MHLIFFKGLVAGDPHFKTLDGFDYTYNGIGEYTLLNLNDKNSGSKIFTLQTRTVEAHDKNNKPMSATVFGGFAALDLQSDVKYQVEMNNNRDGKIISQFSLFCFVCLFCFLVHYRRFPSVERIFF